MENLVLLFIIAAIAFWLGRKTKQYPSPSKRTSQATALHAIDRFSGPAQTRRPMSFQRASAMIFITGWIIAWSASIWMAVLMFISSFGNGFTTIVVGGWLIAASAGWLCAAIVIYKLVTGKPVRFGGTQNYSGRSSL